MRLVCCLVVSCVSVWAQQPAARQGIKPVPPPGVEVPANDRAALEAGLARLSAATEKLKGNALLPDVLIYQEAVRYALQYNEFFRADEIAKARGLLRAGEERAGQLANGESPWKHATGLVVRGYVSKIDKSVQPYGLVVPASYSPTAPRRWRVDAWFHGRNETLSEVNFLYDRERNAGEFTPKDTIVLHLYGRYCNASKLAGEVDFFEALDAVKRQYPVDENRILIRGFSMGGNSAWHIGAHFAGLWAAVAPGAGFSETVEFLRWRPDGPNAPTAWERSLFHQYDATDYAINLANTSTVAYNGDQDGQKQAADAMERSMKEEGMRLLRIVGPQTGHRYHPDSKIEIDRRLDAIAEKGRDVYPRRVRFTTWTLRYNQMKWVTVDALGKHWERARLNADVEGDRTVKVETSNVTAFTLSMGAGAGLLDPASKTTVAIDGQKVAVDGPASDGSWTARFRKSGTQWAEAKDEPAGLAKRHGLQGPVDDAFLDSFVFVTPTGTPAVAAVAGWVEAEQKRAIKEWRRQLRGEAQVREDAAVTDADIASSNLVLWGDPGSNKVLARIADKLPVKWTADGVAIGAQKYSATHAPILIYPNPLNPKKYVVLNSGVTFREFDNLNNARQIPKLPDYAVVDTTVPPDERWPGKVVAAGFFDEEWKIK